jgi:hypothetical protein
MSRTINCWNCGQPNWDESLYCQECHAPLRDKKEISDRDLLIKKHIIKEV